MKIKHSRKLDQLLEQCNAKDIEKVADLSILSEFENAEREGDNVEITQTAIESGMRLIDKFHKKLAKHNDKWVGSVPAEDRGFGIWMLVQPDVDGENLFYFIGTMADIKAKIKKVPENRTYMA